MNSCVYCDKNDAVMIQNGILIERELNDAVCDMKLAQVCIKCVESDVQWFGNLVTMQWWNDLWLNEGFAKFMEFVSVNITHPELQVVRTINTANSWDCDDMEL